ncbi:MAG: hypothetical protein U0T83_02690 [Bacteriovoracaceae bacterium]
MKRFTLSMTLSLLSLGSVYGTEIDNFTQRYTDIKDSQEILNQITNENMALAITEANKKGSCDEKRLYKAIQKSLGGALWGKLEKIIVKDDRIDKRAIKIGDSIYGDTGFKQSVIFSFVDLGVILRMNDDIVGSDKFGHFFKEGYEYFKIAYLKNKGESAAMDWGESTERGFFGMATTGVYSYADLNANYQGMQFWKNLIAGKYAAVNPMVTCEENKWKIARTFNWADYISPAWDEAINCSGLKHPSKIKGFTERAYKRMKKLEDKLGEKFVCPISVQKCEDIMIVHDNDTAKGERLISPKCIEIR